MAPETHVLIVDDEERFRLTTRNLLETRGVNADTAAGPLEALETLKTARFDVVILDVQMPDMSGVDLLAEIKKLDPTVEVIMMTGYASFETARRITELGAFDYLLKPCSLDELVDKIEAAQDRKKARESLRLSR